MYARSLLETGRYDHNYQARLALSRVMRACGWKDNDKVLIQHGTGRQANDPNDFEGGPVALLVKAAYDMYNGGNSSTPALLRIFPKWVREHTPDFGRIGVRGYERCEHPVQWIGFVMADVLPPNVGDRLRKNPAQILKHAKAKQKAKKVRDAATPGNMTDVAEMLASGYRASLRAHMRSSVIVRPVVLGYTRHAFVDDEGEEDDDEDEYDELEEDDAWGLDEEEEYM